MGEQKNDNGDGRSPGLRSEQAPEALCVKRAYRRPVLVRYGSIKQLTQAVSGVGADGAGRMMMSDPATKENATRIGEHALGFGLYLFEFKPKFRAIHGSGRKFGVMADEVARVAPHAVSIDAQGYRIVDYDRIGVVVPSR